MSQMLLETDQVLGLKGQSSALDWSERVSKGLPTESLEAICRALSPEDGSLIYRIVPRSTLIRRRRQARLHPEESEVVQRLAEIWALAVNIFGDEDKARRFLKRAHPLLRGALPLDLVIANSQGAKAVEGILGRLKYGSAA